MNTRICRDHAQPVTLEHARSLSPHSTRPAPSPNADPRFKPRFKPPTKKPWFKPRFVPPESWCGLNPGLNLGSNRRGGSNRYRPVRLQLRFYSPLAFFLAQRISRFGFDPPARPIRVGPARAPDPGLTRPAPAPSGGRPRARTHARARAPTPGQPPGSRYRSYTGHQANSRRAHTHSS